MEEFFASSIRNSHCLFTFKKELRFIIMRSTTRASKAMDMNTCTSILSKASDLDKLHVVVIAEPFGESAKFLAPIAPHPSLPFALLPICNTPLIDYILENLMENRVNKVTVLVREDDVEIQEHLNTNSVVGQSCKSSDKLKVKALLPSNGPITLFNACASIVADNVVAQGSSVLIFPVNALYAFTNLRNLFKMHLLRAESIPQYTATVLCTSMRDTLKAALHSVLESVYGLEGPLGEIQRNRADKCRSVSSNESENHYDELEGGSVDRDQDPLANSNGGYNGKALASNGLRRRGWVRGHAVPMYPKDNHCIIAFQEETEVISHISRFESSVENDEEEDDEVSFNAKPAQIRFSKNVQCVRTDLLPTNCLFLCSSAFPLLTCGSNDVFHFLNELLASEEVTGNCFGFIEVNRSAGMLENITTMDSYLRANIDVCGRRFYPMTRESCFAESQLCYEVAPWCETVYLHTTSKAPPGQGFTPLQRLNSRSSLRSSAEGPETERMIGPYVVLGPRVSLPSDTLHFCGVSCEEDVVVGDECSLVGCVLMAGAKIGSRCRLRYVVVGRNAVIESDISLAHCFVEHGATVTHTSCSLLNASYGRSAPLSLAPSTTSTPAITATDGIPHLPPMPMLPASTAGAFRVHVEKMVFLAKPKKGDSQAEGISSSDTDSGDDDDDNALIRPLPPNPILPTEALFSFDRNPFENAEETSDDESAEKANHTKFLAIIREGVKSAYLMPYSLPARKVELTTACVSYRFTYPELCRFVTQFLIEHLENSTIEMKSEEAILDKAREVLRYWLAEFYDYVLGKNAAELSQAMMFILEGLCEAIQDEKSHLFPYIGGLLDLFHDGCNREVYSSRYYCLVNTQALKQFADSKLKQYSEMGSGPKKGGAASDSSSDSSDSSSSSSDDSDDESENPPSSLPAILACAHYIKEKLIPRIQSKFSFFAKSNYVLDSLSDSD